MHAISTHQIMNCIFLIFESLLYILGEILQSKFKNLKDTYRKLKADSKTKSGQGAETTPLAKWQYSGALEFLKPHMQDARYSFDIFFTNP